jgi:hypothetical protein
MDTRSHTHLPLPVPVQAPHPNHTHNHTHNSIPPTVPTYLPVCAAFLPLPGRARGTSAARAPRLGRDLAPPRAAEWPAQTRARKCRRRRPAAPGTPAIAGVWCAPPRPPALPRRSWSGAGARRRTRSASTTAGCRTGGRSACACLASQGRQTQPSVKN